MGLIKHIAFVQIFTCNLMQVWAQQLPPINGGFTHCTFINSNVKPIITNTFAESNKQLISNTATEKEFQYGFGIGIFAWVPLNKQLVFKPKMECLFSSNQLKQQTVTNSTAFDIRVTYGFAINLKQANKNGIIYLARNMSCYLTTKQPYALCGPIINLKKFDKGYLHKGFENEFSFGFMVGYGINYEFHGLYVAPEISYSLTKTAQNKVDATNKTTHTITLALNLF